MIIEEKILDLDIYIESSNVNFSIYRYMLENNFYANNNDYANLNFYDYNTSSTFFCINLSNGCNLKCDYCFNTNKDGKSIDLNIIKQYLDLCFNTYPNKEKYYVDLSGKGEPLLFIKTILEVKESRI